MIDYPPILKGSAENQTAQLRAYLVRLVQNINETFRELQEAVEGAKTRSENTTSQSVSKRAASSARNIYDVGDLFITTRSGDPATLLGYGTWTQIKDRFLLAAGDSYTAGDTGGESSHTLTTDEIPAHAGHLGVNSGFPSTGNLTGKYLPTTAFTNYGSAARGWNEASAGEAYPAGEDRGGGQAHNNMPPYLVVYVWMRTA